LQVKVLFNPWQYSKNILATCGQAATDTVGEVGAMLMFLGRSIAAGARPPYRVALTLQQMEFVGFGSLFIVMLTGLFTGAVFTLQSVNALERVGMESMVGSTVLIAVARELSPVLASLMVTGRVGSAMATELGTMRVSEQIDAMEVMAVEPLQYLIAPRLIAGTVMLPCLVVVFDMVASLGSYAVAVLFLHIDEGSYMARIKWYLDPSDFVHGILKGAVFGLVIALVGCYKGFNAKGGARGVGSATTQTVVIGSISIFVLDYVLTSLLLKSLSK
jgi:phospholipid/cholesterol/gamma-HCH transport system permease protein